MVGWNNLKTLRKLLCGIVLVLGVITVLLTIYSKSSDVATFRFVDRYGKHPITNVNVESSGRWTGIPLEKLKLPGIHSWRKTRSISRGESTTINIPRNKNFYITFESPGYGTADYIQESGTTWIHYRGGDAIRQRIRTNLFIIQLEPEIQGPPGPFELYCVQAELIERSKTTNDN